MSLMVSVGDMLSCTEAMGPGKRACIWVAGCPFRCKGCMTPDLLTRRDAESVSVEELCRFVHDAWWEYGIEGVSFSGGEPFAQAGALSDVARFARGLGLGTLSWSGYTLEELRGREAPPGARLLLAELDVLIDGRFERDQVQGQPFRGSSNQRILLFTPRYRAADFASAKVEVRDDGKRGLTLYGVTDPRPFTIVHGLLGT